MNERRRKNVFSRAFANSLSQLFWLYRSHEPQIHETKSTRWCFSKRLFFSSSPFRNRRHVEFINEKNTCLANASTAQKRFKFFWPFWLVKCRHRVSYESSSELFGFHLNSTSIFTCLSLSSWANFKVCNVKWLKFVFRSTPISWCMKIMEGKWLARKSRSTQKKNLESIIWMLKQILVVHKGHSRRRMNGRFPSILFAYGQTFHQILIELILIIQKHKLIFFLCNFPNEFNWFDIINFRFSLW